MIYNMTLNDPWFDLMKTGKKIYEGRRNTEKIRSIKVGDIIQISHHVNKHIEPLYVVVTEIHNFASFEEALKTLPINEILPIENINIEKGIEIYLKYVSLETQLKDGVIMLKIFNLCN